MVARNLACAAILLCSAVASPAFAQTRAVIELFTSQGCSSCPAADKLLGELAGDPSLLAMSLAVDMWDYLGWKDTLALHAHTKRQRAYAQARHDREVYTPQVVVNGAMHVLGSDRNAIDRAIMQTKKHQALLALPVTVTVSGSDIAVSVPGGSADKGEAWPCPISKAVTVAIGRGENNGRTITYHNVVRRWIKLGDWTGKAETWTMELAKVKMEMETIDRVAVVVQRGVAASPSLMLGAAMASLK
jgi:hypothetical protein